MRLIKAFLVGAVVLFFVITLFSLLIPSKVLVSRGVLINNTSIGNVYPQIAGLENWRNWHPVFKADSAKLYRIAIGKDSGYSIIHRGKKAVISSISSDSATIRFLLTADGENDIDNVIVISTLSTRSVQVEWRAITRLHWYPWEKFYGIFVDNLTGPGYEAALNGLKDFIEKGALSSEK